jgi:hypothetical protein
MEGCGKLYVLKGRLIGLVLFGKNERELAFVQRLGIIGMKQVSQFTATQRANGPGP